MAEDEKKVIECPILPNVIQGDGRYVMSLLKEFLAETAKQVNLANGFAAEEVEPDDDASVQTPRNFFLSFTRLGASLSWDHIKDVSELAYYEVREDKSVGSESGLLERTLDNCSSRAPMSYVGVIYLYAVNRDKEYSQPAELRYTKPRPEAPQDIALTRSNEGTLITFLEIPTNCIGANVYVNDYLYQTLDNIFLFKHGGDMQIRKVEVAYYDGFGEGERAVVYCVLPDVAGFSVERNGAVLDFYWDALNIYGVEYVVKISVSPDWDKALEVFRTKISKHRYICPNVGSYYFLIKAVDERNNYSVNASYISLFNVPDVAKNVILDLDQSKTAYGGNKVNLYYDVAADGLKLERDMLRGEYIVPVVLPRRYRARNWFDYKVIGTTGEEMRLGDMHFDWRSEMAQGMTWLGVIGDLNGVRVRQQIARYQGTAPADIDSISFDGSLATEKGVLPVEQVKAADFRAGRWSKGLYIDGSTRVSYRLRAMTPVFHMIFYVKKVDVWQDTGFLTLRSGGSYLLLGYEAEFNAFFLKGSDGVKLQVESKSLGRDWIAFGISQGPASRGLFVNSFGLGLTLQAVAAAEPLPVLDELYLYPKLV